MVINFKKKLYSLAAINGAIKEFGHLADFTVKQKDNNIMVEIVNAGDEVSEVLGDEFSNYALYLMKI